MPLYLLSISFLPLPLLLFTLFPTLFSVSLINKLVIEFLFAEGLTLKEYRVCLWRSNDLDARILIENIDMINKEINKDLKGICLHWLIRSSMLLPVCLNVRLLLI